MRSSKLADQNAPRLALRLLRRHEPKCLSARHAGEETEALAKPFAIGGIAQTSPEISAQSERGAAHI